MVTAFHTYDKKTLLLVGPSPLIRQVSGLVQNNMGGLFSALGEAAENVAICIALNNLQWTCLYRLLESTTSCFITPAVRFLPMSKSKQKWRCWLAMLRKAINEIYHHSASTALQECFEVA